VKPDYNHEHHRGKSEEHPHNRYGVWAECHQASRTAKEFGTAQEMLRQVSSGLLRFQLAANFAARKDRGTDIDVKAATIQGGSWLQRKTLPQGVGVCKVHQDYLLLRFLQTVNSL